MLVLWGCQNQPIKTEEQNGAAYISSSDGTDINYRWQDTPGATPLVLIHCLGCNQEYWQAQVEAFSSDYAVLTLDLAGHGASDFARDEYTVSSYADDVHAVISHLQLAQPVIVGHGLGGAVAVELAAKSADNLKAVVTVNSFYGEQHWPQAEQLDDFFKPYRENYYQAQFPQIKNRFLLSTDRSLSYNIARDIARAPQEVGENYFAHYHRWMAEQSRQKLAEVSVPIMHINSTRGTEPHEHHLHTMTQYIHHGQNQTRHVRPKPGYPCADKSRGES